MGKKYFYPPLAFGLCLGFIVGYISANYYSIPKPQTQKTELLLPYKTITAKNVTEQDRKQIEDFVAKFYEYQQKREVNKLLALFTPAASKQEQNDLEFLLGKDLARISAKLQTRVFTTQGYNYTLVGYYVRDITRHNDTITVSADEMRVIYSGGEYVGYSTNITNLTLEIAQTKTEQKVVNYYHTNASRVSKYEGLNGY